MINGSDKQAFLIVTNRISKDIIKRYHKLRKATATLGDVIILCHTNNSNTLAQFEGIKIETFTNDILTDLHYKPIAKTLVPGSNHFPVLNFFLHHPEYSFYWGIEDDVEFRGDWSNFFDNISAGSDYDFITSHIRRYVDLRQWHWWKTLISPETKIYREEMLNSFNPIYRISNSALKYIDNCLKGGYSGHHEVLLPTLLNKAGFTIADFGSVDNHVTPALSYCTLRTMRWKPVFLFPTNQKNKLYHPAKSKITFKQVLVYVKRTVYNQKEYFS